MLELNSQAHAGPAPGAGRGPWSPEPRSDGSAPVTEVAESASAARRRSPIRSTPCGPRRSAPRWPRCGPPGGSTDAALFATVTPGGADQGGSSVPSGPVTRWTGGSGWSSSPGPEARDRGRGGPARRRGRGVDRAPDVRPALLFDDSYRAIIALRADPAWQRAMALRGITDFDKVQIDPWPTGNFGNPSRTAAGSPGASRTTARSPTDNGYARPIEGVLATVDAARGEVLEVLDFGVVPLPADRAATAPRTTSRCAPDLARWRSSSPRGRASRSTPISCPGSAGRCGCPWTPCEGLVLHTIGYDDGGRRGRSCTGPPSARWSSPTATRGPCTAGRTPSTWASGASAAWPTPWPSAATASGRSPTSTPPSAASTATPTWWRTPSASTRRTTASSGSTRT